MNLETLQALSFLPPRQREALVDRVLREDTAEEVASRMGISVGRVGELVAAGKANLAPLLNQIERNI